MNGVELSLDLNGKTITVMVEPALRYCPPVLSIRVGETTLRLTGSDMVFSEIGEAIRQYLDRDRSNLPA